MIRLLLLVLLFVPWTSQSQQLYNRTLKLMGSRFDLSVVAADSVSGQAYLETAVMEIQRIEKLISSWDPSSQTSEINRNAGIKPVSVDPELYDLIERSLKISRLTDGAFDITYASMDKLWKFDGSMTSIPPEADIQLSVSKVGYEQVVLNSDNFSVFLPETGMKIGFGAIGKGYAADKAKALLISKGVKAGIINASGDMNTWGKPPHEESWNVAITNPVNRNKVFAVLPISDGAVVTSGDYERYVTFNGVRYTHIINPKTGYPASGIVSVTVFAPKAELADALATSVFVMGIDVGLNRINQLPGVECIIIDDHGQVKTSQNIQIEKQ